MSTLATAVPPTAIVYSLSLIGVFVFAMSGALAAGRKGLDWVGVVALAVVTAIGGGTVRDVLLNRGTVFWIEQPEYVWVILAGAALTIVWVRFFEPPYKALLVADALGLAMFSIVGAQIAERQLVAFPIVVVMGVLTGTAGGVLRDVLTGEIPLVFRPTETLYSVAAVAGVVVYLLLARAGLGRIPASLSGVLVIAVLRFAAIRWRISLPAFHVSGERGDGTGEAG